MARYLVQVIDRHHGQDKIKTMEVEARKPCIAGMVALNNYEYKGDRLAVVVTPMTQGVTR